MTRSEEFVTNLSQRSFLSFWSFPSPLGKRGNELCDLLAVCGSDILIVSVKEIVPKNTGDEEKDYKRWYRKAVEESCDQIKGAERFLKMNDAFVAQDRKTTIPLPNHEDRRYFRLAVAFGRGEEYPLFESSTDSESYIHVFDEEALVAAMDELDTFSDFVKYLSEKESLAERASMVMHPGEKHLLAFYLLAGRTFPDQEDFVFTLHDDLWSGMKSDPRYLEWKEEIKFSYGWDWLIETFAKYHSEGSLTTGLSREDLEMTLRHMARENRFERSRLFESLMEVLGGNGERKIGARIHTSALDDSAVYVFLVGHTSDRESRSKELHMRTLIAKSIHPHKQYFIGIASDPLENEPSSFDLCYMELQGWSIEMENKAKKLMELTGYFKNMIRNVIPGIN